MVFDITNRKSLEELKKIHDQIVQIYEPEKAPIVLAGNKVDLRGDENFPDQVTTEEGNKIASDWACTFLETSAKTKVKHEECFKQVVREIRKLDKGKQQADVPKKKKGFCTLL